MPNPITPPRTAIAKAIPSANSTITEAATPAVTASVFDHLPDSALLRESQLVQSPKRPHGTAPLPFSSATLWRMSKKGTFPKPIKLAQRVTAWRVGDVRAWLNACEAA